MYIEFTLPSGAGGMPAHYVNQTLNKFLQEWSDRYEIRYVKKLYKYTVRVTFDDDNHYAFFALTWNPKAEDFNHYFANFKLLDPMIIDKTK